MVATPDAAGQTAVLGALEELHGVYTGESNSYGVRVLFEKSGTEWLAFPNNCPDQDCVKTASLRYPAETHWTISFSGRKLGRVTGRTPSSFHFYSHVGLQEIVGKQTIPTVGSRSREFGGFSEAVVHRPLVAISRPNFKDPDSWKRVVLPSQLAKLVRLEFRKKFPNVSNCTNVEAEPKPWSYGDRDIKLIKTYSSQKGWFLVRVKLNEYRCDGMIEGPFADQWFTISPTKNIRFLDSDMWLIDAGDYDDDGKSEILFAIDGDNRGGYRLFYDDFKKQAVFEYSYH